MVPFITVTNKEQELGHLVVIVSKFSKLPAGIFSSAEKAFLKTQVETLKQDVVSFNRLSYWVYVYFVRDEKDLSKRLETSRKTGDKVAALLNNQKATRVTIFDAESDGDVVLAFAEGMALGCYQFLKYKKDKENENTLREIEIYSKVLEESENDASVPDHSSFVIRHSSFVIRHSSLVTRHSSFVIIKAFIKLKQNFP